MKFNKNEFGWKEKSNNGVLNINDLKELNVPYVKKNEMVLNSKDCVKYYIENNGEDDFFVIKMCDINTIKDAKKFKHLKLSFKDKLLIDNEIICVYPYTGYLFVYEGVDLTVCSIFKDYQANDIFLENGLWIGAMCNDLLSSVGGDYDYMDADIFYDMLDINVYYEEYEINNANNMIKTTDYIIDNDIVYITLTTDKYQYIENLKNLMSFSGININLPSIENKYNIEIHVFLNFNEITPT